MTEQSNAEQRGELPDNAKQAREILLRQTRDGIFPRDSNNLGSGTYNLRGCKLFLIDIFNDTSEHGRKNHGGWRLSSITVDGSALYCNNCTVQIYRHEEEEGNIKCETRGDTYAFSIVPKTSEHEEGIKSSLEELGLLDIVEVDPPKNEDSN